MSRPFAKYEGLGNDFLVLDAASWPLADLTPDLASTLCDRHRGVGGDGLLWIGPAEGTPSATRFVIFNADGSRPEMCGNGVRCVAAYLFDEGRLRMGETLELLTDAGPRPARLVAQGAGGSVQVEVDMGEVRVAPAPAEIDLPGAHLRALPVDVGNPHAVIFDAPRRGDPVPLVRAVESRTDLFPGGVNVEFVASLPSGGFEVRVHERGVGWTQACGTGACAVAAAAVSCGLPGAREGVPVRVMLEGGALEVTVARNTRGVLCARMKGPARRVFRGELDESALARPEIRGRA